MMYIPTDNALDTPPLCMWMGCVRTVLSKTLQQSADDHNDGTNEDRHASTVLLAQPGCDRNCKNGTELVA